MFNIQYLLKHGAQQRHYSKGQIIFYEGDEVKYFFVIVEGKVKMINTNADNKEFIQGIFYERQSFGEPSLFTVEQTSPSTAIADSDVEILRLEKNSFFKLLKANFDLHLEITKALAEKIQFKIIISKEISGYKPEHRLETLFQYLKRNSVKHKNKTTLDLTRQELANLTGLRVETVIRAVKKLESEGKLKIVNRKIYLE
jgi:CRP-like cAMP-binding protein